MEFKVGDKVRHKGSGKTAVVTKIVSKCFKHTFTEHFVDAGRKLINKPPKYGPCSYTWPGYLDVQYTVNGDDKRVVGNHFEVVK